MSPEPSQRVVLVRHGETDWSRSGRHTGRQDIPLTEAGRTQARAVAPALAGWHFAAVLCSPLRRARETCDLAGVGMDAIIDADLCEWNYGDYEGLTSDQIRETRPGWVIWKDGVIGGETAADVGARAERAVARIRGFDGDVCVVAHGHLLRILTARWLDLAPVEGHCFELGPASVSVLGYERGLAAIARWNDRHHLAGLDRLSP